MIKGIKSNNNNNNNNNNNKIKETIIVPNIYECTKVNLYLKY